MSWHRSYSNRAQFNADTPQYWSGAPSEQQLHEARAAAESIIESGAVIPQGGDAMVNLSGRERTAVHLGSQSLSISVTAIG